MKDIRRKVILIALAAAALLPKVRPLTLCFLGALLLASGLQMPMRRAEQLHLPRGVAALGLLLLILVPLGFLLVFGGLCLVKWVQQMITKLVPLFQSGGAIDNWIYVRITALPPDLRNGITAAIDYLNEQKEALIPQIVAKLSAWSTEWLGALPRHIGSFALFLLALFFCTVGYPELKALLLELIPEDWRQGLGRVQRTLTEQLSCWLRAESTLAGLILCELTVGLLALRVKLWAVAALCITLVDIIPMVGSGLVLIPWAAIQWILGAHTQAVGLLLLWFCVWLTRTMLEPKLLGHHLHLPSALSFFSAILGAKLLGLKGLILFPVLSAAGVSLLSKKKTGVTPKDDAC